MPSWGGASVSVCLKTGYPNWHSFPVPERSERWTGGFGSSKLGLLLCWFGSVQKSAVVGHRSRLHFFLLGWFSFLLWIGNLLELFPFSENVTSEADTISNPPKEMWPFLGPTTSLPSICTCWTRGPRRLSQRTLGFRASWCLPWKFKSCRCGCTVKSTSRLGVHPGCPLVNLQKAMENGPFIDGLPISNGDFL